jgi:hypothetical protein
MADALANQDERRVKGFEAATTAAAFARFS